MKNLSQRSLAVLITAGLGACTTIPPAGPAVTVLPGSSASFDQFRIDDSVCRQFAQTSLGPATPAQAAADSAINSAAAGAAVGAAAGALIGAAAGDPGEGAALGAGAGLLAGGAGGVGAYHEAAWQTQERYDTAYIQCMYAKGHQVPVPASLQSSAASRYTAPATPGVPPPRPRAALPPPPR
jgi:hypothetical protein